MLPDDDDDNDEPTDPGIRAPSHRPASASPASSSGETSAVTASSEQRAASPTTGSGEMRARSATTSSSELRAPLPREGTVVRSSAPPPPVMTRTVPTAARGTPSTAPAAVATRSTSSPSMAAPAMRSSTVPSTPARPSMPGEARPSSPGTLPARPSGAPPSMRPSAPPGGEFLMPRPSAPPPAATRSAGALDLTPSPADPWRERIAQLEVQLAAARAESTRRAEESAQLRARLDALEPMARGATEQLASLTERMERALAEARGWAERPLPVGALEARMTEVESLAASVRASMATATHDIAEHGRMFEARAARMASLESRIALVERDPERNELRLAAERLDLRLTALAKTLEQLSHEVRDRVARAEHRADESEKHALRAASDAQKALARSHEAIDAQDALREEAKLDALLPRLADVEALVLENGRNDALQRKRLDALEARVGAGTATAPAEPSAEAPATAGEAARGAEEDGDDLRRIKGIGPAYAKALRAMGVSRFADIAAWDDAALARVAEALGTKKDRLAKWTEKARALVAGGD